MAHISGGDDDLYLQARNLAVMLSFGKETAESCYSENPYSTKREFINALVAHIRYLERIGDPNRLINPDVKKFEKLCRENPAKPFKQAEAKNMKNEESKEKPKVFGLDFERAYQIGKFTQFVPLNPHGHVIGNREEYIRGLVDHIDQLPPYELSPEIKEWQAKARSKILDRGEGS